MRLAYFFFHLHPISFPSNRLSYQVFPNVIHCFNGARRAAKLKEKIFNDAHPMHQMTFALLIILIDIIFVCSHQPKTEELLELLFFLFLFFTIWFISSFKRNSSEKISPGLGIKVGSFCSPAKRYNSFVESWIKNYLIKLKISKTTPQTLDQYWPC